MTRKSLTPSFIELLGNMGHEIVNEKLIPYPDLKVGMVLARDLVSREGILLLAVNFVLNVAQIKQINDYAHRENYAIPIYIRTDKTRRE